MTDNHLKNLRRLAKRYQIRFSLPSDTWPEFHADTFRIIEELGRYRFDTYAQNVTIRSPEEPWTCQTKSRAEWLTKRAGSLFNQNRNEAGWRFAIENDVLRRFSAEVACPRCRARIWQSEIQVTMKNNETYSKQLEDRQKSRRPCQCSYSKHSYDFYETGTNRLFEDRAEEFVIYDDIMRSQLKKQGPDRVYGLKNTGNFESLLSSPAPPELANEPGETIGDTIKHTPFDSVTDPLLFPFLLLEAKSESSSNGFDDIQIQSAFPIRALLKLQEDLQASSSIPDPGMAPLVWFLACRGDAWKVYGCYTIPGEGESPTKYEISMLWSGSLVHKDQALQLVLIVDYIMDWARDIYRIEILTHLRSIVTGQILDEMTYRDSDMFSTYRDGSIFNWIPPAKSIVTEERRDSGSVVSTDDLETSSSDLGTGHSFNHQSMLNTTIPNTELGSVRSAILSHFHFECLYITSDLIPSLFEMIGGKDQNKGRIESEARSFVNFVTQFDETLVMSGRDLQLLELLWTGFTRAESEVCPEEFFVTMEARWYFNTSWNIKRQISCLAISRTAFDKLIKAANFRVKHQGVQNLRNTERILHEDQIRDLVKCLASGSPWQVLLATISSTLITLYPFPLRKRQDFTPELEAVGFGYIRDARVDPFIQKILRRQMWAPTKRINVSDSDMRAARRKGMTIKEVLSSRRAKGEKRPKHEDMSFKRISECQKLIMTDEVHSPDHCARCRLSQEQNISSLGHGYLDHRSTPAMSSRQTVIVISLRANEPRRVNGEPDICVFGLDELSQLKDSSSFATMIEEMTLRTSSIFHTLKFDPGHLATRTDEVEHNLPLPYRPITRQEKPLITNWIRELRGHSLDPPPAGGYDYFENWNYNQKFMFLLSMGHSEEEASLLLEYKPWPNPRSFGTMAEVVYAVNTKKGFLNFPPSTLRKKSKIAGDQLVNSFASWEAAREFLHRSYPHQARLLMSIPKGKWRKKGKERAREREGQEYETRQKDEEGRQKGKGKQKDLCSNNDMELWIEVCRRSVQLLRDSQSKDDSSSYKRTI